ncbi:MAG: hypothetical protein V7K48_05365 [Nostoc sp.]
MPAAGCTNADELDPPQHFLKRRELVPQGGSQKSKVKSQKNFIPGFCAILNSLLIYAVLY